MTAVASLTRRIRWLELELIETRAARSLLEDSGLRVELDQEGVPLLTIDRPLVTPDPPEYVDEVRVQERLRAIRA